MFEEMQGEIRTEVVRALFHARPVREEALDQPIETELTRAAAKSVESGAQESVSESLTKGFKRAKDDQPAASVVVQPIDVHEEKRKKRQASKKKKAQRRKGRR
jgi:hypothetical protein